MMPYLFVARTEPVRTPKFSSDNASNKRQFCRLSLALSLPVRLHPKARSRPKDSWLERLQDCKKVKIEARTPEARNSLQCRNESTIFIDIFQYLIVKNFNYFF